MATSLGIVKPIYMLVYADDWEAFAAESEFIASSLHQEGFLHASSSVEQLIWVANRRFTDGRKVVVLCADPLLITAELKYELAASYPEPFPHVYGALNLDAVFEVWELERNARGEFVAPLP